LTTEVAPAPDKTTGRTPTEEEMAKCQRVRPIMHEILETKGLVSVAEDKVLVTGLKGPLEQDWENKVRTFGTRLSTALGLAAQAEPTTRLSSHAA
jgi:hypothetical protein